MREKETHTSMIMVRHGEPDYPEDRIYARADDPGLTSRGMDQAQALGKWLARERIAAVYVSPTRRTRETALPITAALGLLPEFDERLVERHFGVWEGLTFDAIRERFPEEFLRWKTDPVGFAPEGGETVLDLSLRVNAALGEYRRRHAGESCLVVFHVGSIRTALCEALCTPIVEYRRFHIAHGSVLRVDYGERQANLMYMGFAPGEDW